MLTLPALNPRLIDAQYAVRGPIVLRALKGPTVFSVGIEDDEVRPAHFRALQDGLNKARNRAGLP